MTSIWTDQCAICYKESKTAICDECLETMIEGLDSSCLCGDSKCPSCGKGYEKGFDAMNTCWYCPNSQSVSGDLAGSTLVCFANGHNYNIANAILHLISEHQYLPPKGFIMDVLFEKTVPLDNKVKSWANIGFLDGGPYDQGCASDAFFVKLWKILNKPSIERTTQ